MANNFDPSVNWSDDEIGGTDKLNQMVVNDNTVYNLMPHFLYKRSTLAVRDFNDSQARLLKPTIFSGRATVRIRGRTGASTAIVFPAGTFAPACRPVVTTSIASSSGQRAMVSTVSGLNGTAEIGNEGFRVHVSHRDANKLHRNVDLHYMVFGWQEA